MLLEERPTEELQALAEHLLDLFPGLRDMANDYGDVIREHGWEGDLDAMYVQLQTLYNRIRDELERRGYEQ